MSTDDSKIIKLFKQIKSSQCETTNCSNEINQLDILIDEFNKKECNRDRYWTKEYEFEKSKLNLIRKNVFSRYIIDGNDIIEKRPGY